MTAPRFLSLFAGVGGLDLGFERAGWDAAGQCEIHEHSLGVLEHRWPHVPRQTDVSHYKHDGSRIDAVIGGFPCQDLSMAGRRAGLAGARSGLFYDAMAVVRDSRPRFVVLENVAGLLTSNRGRDFGSVIRELADAGYPHVEWRVLDSQFFGVPQRRRRVIIVGSAGTPATLPILAEPEGRRRNPRALLEAASQVAAYPVRRSERRRVAGTLAASGAEPGQGLVPLMQDDEGQIVGALEVERSWRPEIVPMDDPLPIAFHQTQDPIHSVDLSPALGATSGGMAVLADLYNQSLHAVSPTVTTTPNVAVMPHVRRLTPIECERLQGFPDDWTAERVEQSGRNKGKIVRQFDSSRYRQMGNAVTVNVAEWVGRRLMETYLEDVHDDS